MMAAAGKWKMFFEKQRIKRLRKLLEFYEIKPIYRDWSEDAIRSLRIGTAEFDGILFIFRGLSPADFLDVDSEFNAYQDAKQEKRIKHQETLVQKNAKHLIDTLNKATERMVAVFSKAVLKPDPNEYDPKDWVDNPMIGHALYNEIQFATYGGKKKLP